MKKIVTQITNLFNSTHETGQFRINLVKAKKEKLNILKEAQTNGNVVGVYCPSLSEGMLLTGVHYISNDNGEAIIIFKPFDLNGVLLLRTELALLEIKTVVAFPCPYENPVLTVKANV